jgi:hypothetical protein
VSVEYRLEATDGRELEVLYKSQDLYEIDRTLCNPAATDLTIYYVSFYFVITICNITSHSIEWCSNNS